MMAASAQRLIAAGLPMEEFPQSPPNLTAASQNLYELIQSGGLAVYHDPGMRLAVSRAIASEGSRGWKIDKAKQAHKIDVVIALGDGRLRRRPKPGRACLRCSRTINGPATVAPMIGIGFSGAFISCVKLMAVSLDSRQ